jgi:outer membrane protein
MQDVALKARICKQWRSTARSMRDTSEPLRFAEPDESEAMKHTSVFLVVCAGWALFLNPAATRAQTVRPAASQASASLAAQPAQTGVPRITMADAIQRAKAISPMLQTAETNARVAAEAAVQARAANLPNVSGVSQYLYTEGNGTLASRFIANNGVHEYIAQADVHQSISAPLFLQYRSSSILAAAARDQAEIAKRGLIVAVVQSYATLVAANGKVASAEGTLKAAQEFLRITRQREQNGEAAHADVVKARIQVSDNQVAVQSAQLAQEEARIALALLIFKSADQNFMVVDDPGHMLQLPAFTKAQQEAQGKDPQVDAALKNEQAAQKSVDAAWMGYLPSLTFDYYYGIDANQFATNGVLPDGQRIQNLGYSALASLNVPIFTWGATHSKVKQAESMRQEAKTALQYARRQHMGDLELFYKQAQMAKQEMEIRKRSTADAVESRKLTLLQYQAGQASALEVVNAESTVSLEQSAWYDAETQYAVALANLATLTGNL